MNQARQYSQKPGAIRERTRMTDIETKWRKDRARLLVRVKAGAVPNEDSQEKYKLSLCLVLSLAENKSKRLRGIGGKDSLTPMVRSFQKY